MGNSCLFLTTILIYILLLVYIISIIIKGTTKATPQKWQKARIWLGICSVVKVVSVVSVD